VSGEIIVAGFLNIGKVTKEDQNRDGGYGNVGRGIEVRAVWYLWTASVNRLENVAVRI
jgi:hypothetical protein